MKCPSCGTDLPKPTKFCGACGHVLASVDDRTNTVPISAQDVQAFHQKPALSTPPKKSEAPAKPKAAKPARAIPKKKPLAPKPTAPAKTGPLPPAHTAGTIPSQPAVAAPLTPAEKTEIVPPEAQTPEAKTVEAQLPDNTKIAPPEQAVDKTEIMPPDEAGAPEVEPGEPAKKPQKAKAKKPEPEPDTAKTPPSVQQVEPSTEEPPQTTADNNEETPMLAAEASGDSIENTADELASQAKSLLKSTPQAGPSKPRGYLLTLQLAVFFGWFGFDRFYLGKIGTGLIKFATMGGFGVWWLIDVLKLLYNKTTDVQGNKLVGSDRIDPIMLIVLSGTPLNRFYLQQTNLGIMKLALPVGAFIISFLFSVIGNLAGVVIIATIGAGLGGLINLVYMIWCLLDAYLAITGKLKAPEGRPIMADEKRYQSVALLFAAGGGFLGLDRFYLGYRSLGMLKLFTFGMFGIWVVLDIIQLILNSLKDCDGKPLVQD